MWNEEAADAHGRRSGNRIYVCLAEDTINGRELSVAERIAVARRGSDRGGRHDQRNGLQNKVTVGIGMSVMVTVNVDTDLDLANGARGTIVGLVLDDEEPDLDEEARVVNLRFPPKYVLVKLDRTKAGRLEDLPEGVIPIEPMERKFKITVQPKSRTRLARDSTTRIVVRRQLPMTLSYAFTDYRSQGQTIRHVIVDIAKPPSGALTLFNIYVALSRSSGRDTIRLLRPFDEDILFAPVDAHLLAEDERLERLNAATKVWWEGVKTRA
jgi:ATP-dependent exoDNAse (exonuclease V) alpha subunit